MSRNLFNRFLIKVYVIMLKLKCSRRVDLMEDLTEDLSLSDL